MSSAFICNLSFIFFVVFRKCKLLLIWFLDVYSYDEDDMVEDCRIKEHLAHFGINIENMEKVVITLYILYYFVILKFFPDFRLIFCNC